MRRTLPWPRKIALIAHDRKKSELLAWVIANKSELAAHKLIATGTTGGLIARETGLEVELVESGPYGGDIRIGAQMVDDQIQALVFFWDPLEPQPHDPDVKALLRVAVLKDIPTASNRATADLLMRSNFFHGVEERLKVS
jgi:methylglyoxal synthase